MRWLEEGRVYRFPSVDAALAEALLLAAALGVDLREARGLAGQTGLVLVRRRRVGGRLLILLAVAAAAGALVAAFTLPLPWSGEGDAAPVRAAPKAKPLAAPWRTRSTCSTAAAASSARARSRAGSAPSRTRSATSAAPTRSTTRRPRSTTSAAARLNAIRLARSLGVVTKPLPGGSNPRRLVVVVGPARGPGQ